jgi:hypothetical protein
MLFFLEVFFRWSNPGLGSRDPRDQEDPRVLRMEWEPLAAASPKPSPRVGHTLSFMRGGQAILFGGRGRDSSDVLADPIQLLPAVDTKKHPEVHGAAPPGRAGHVACTLTERSAVTPHSATPGGG